MTLYRFVGQREYNNIMSGGAEYNDRDWSEYCDTNSKGICFFAHEAEDIHEVVEDVLDNWGLSGIVKTFAIFKLEVKEAREAWGFYSGGMKTEYNLTRYTCRNLTAVWKLSDEYWEDEEGHFFCYRAQEVKL